jgi:hypothetical protein
MTLVLIAMLGLVKTGCDYSMVEEPVVIPALKISITPQTAEMQKGSSLNLSAIISGYKSTGTVTWEFAGSAAGELTGSGLTAAYKAPATLVASPLIVSIRVRSVEDTSRYATATLTILDTVTNGGSNNGGGNGNQITLSVGPSSATIEPGQTLQFTATVTGTSNTGVTWRVVTGLGTISNSGLFAAPSTLTATQTTTIEATLMADPTIKATAKVIVRKPIDPNLVCFERDVMPIFADNCAVSGCHTASNPNPPEGILLDTYDQIIAAMKHDDDDGDDDHDNEILDVITEDDVDKRMPYMRPALSAAKIDIIRRWINQGAKNEPCEDPGSGGNNGNGCDTLNLSFANTIKPIFDAQCIGCHQGSNPPKGINLTSHAGIRSAAQTGQLVGAITHTSPYTPMPLAPRPKLDDCTIAKIKAWINTGMPNN